MNKYLAVLIHQQHEHTVVTEDDMHEKVVLVFYRWDGWHNQIDGNYPDILKKIYAVFFSINGQMISNE